MTDSERATKFEQLAEDMAAHATRCLGMIADAHERERRLIGMVEDRDRVIEGLRARIALLGEPDGWVAGW